MRAGHNGSALLFVTLRLFATRGFPPTRAGLWGLRPYRSPSLQSIRAAHDGSALLFVEFNKTLKGWQFTPTLSCGMICHSISKL